MSSKALNFFDTEIEKKYISYLLFVIKYRALLFFVFFHRMCHSLQDPRKRKVLTIIVRAYRSVSCSGIRESDNVQREGDKS